MEITPASETDADEIAEINKSFHLDFDGFKWDTVDWVKEEISLGNYFVLKNDQNDQIYGAICIKSLEDECYIEAMAVSAVEKSRGLGRKLVEFARDHTVREGKSSLTVESFIEYGVDGFYERCGFTKEDKLGRFGKMRYYCFFMEVGE